MWLESRELECNQLHWALLERPWKRFGEGEFCSVYSSLSGRDAATGRQAPSGHQRYAQLWDDSLGLAVAGMRCHSGSSLSPSVLSPHSPGNLLATNSTSPAQDMLENWKGIFWPLQNVLTKYTSILLIPQAPVRPRRKHFWKCCDNTESLDLPSREPDVIFWRLHQSRAPLRPRPQAPPYSWNGFFVGLVFVPTPSVAWTSPTPHCPAGKRGWVSLPRSRPVKFPAVKRLQDSNNNRNKGSVSCLRGLFQLYDICHETQYSLPSNKHRNRSTRLGIPGTSSNPTSWRDQSI